MMKIIESPREGMQGFDKLIPTDQKVRYINALLRAGFDTVEIGSIVSPRLVPQMADSLEVLGKLDISGTRSNLMFLALNRKGAEIIAAREEITHISYPFSFSPTFLARNVRATVEEAFGTVEYVANLCAKTGKMRRDIYLLCFRKSLRRSMECRPPARVGRKTCKCRSQDHPVVECLHRDLCGSDPGLVGPLINAHPDAEFGLHLHTASHDWHPKLEAAYEAGVRRFDAVIDGHGGCPMTGKEMMGNLVTQNLLMFMNKHNLPDGLDREALEESVEDGRRDVCGLNQKSKIKIIKKQKSKNKYVSD